MANKWIIHVKAYAKEHDCSYKEALSRASASYKKSGKGAKFGKTNKVTPRVKRDRAFETADYDFAAAKKKEDDKFRNERARSGLERHFGKPKTKRPKKPRKGKEGRGKMLDKIKKTVGRKKKKRVLKTTKIKVGSKRKDSKPMSEAEVQRILRNLRLRDDGYNVPI